MFRIKVSRNQLRFFDMSPETEIYTGFQISITIWHSVLEVRESLSGQFDLWIGNGAPILWPPNSPDLTPLDTFL